MPKSMNHPGSGWDINNIVYGAMTIGDWSFFQLVDSVLSPVTPGRSAIDPTIDALDRRAEHARKPWIGDGVHALNVPEVSLSDYSPTSLGNMKRVDQTVDWLQERGTRLDNKIAGARCIAALCWAREPRNTAIDSVQWRFLGAPTAGVSRIGMQIVDEMLLNNIENGVDGSINAFRVTPPEVIVD